MKRIRDEKEGEREKKRCEEVKVENGRQINFGG
jgi:hypothetical protein